MKKKCVRRADGAIVHRTRMLYLGGTRKKPGYYVGRACGCRNRVLTEGGNVSAPVRHVGPFMRTVPTQAHQRRIAALR